MMRCPTCSSEVSEQSATCPRCGSALDWAGTMPTVATPSTPVRSTPRPPSHPPSSQLGELGFAPGEMFAERYRIVGLLGRGGMGEVYRADDLRLGHTVALKFLARKFSQDADLLQRFYAEVRLARQVSHPNVCRVYDVGEFNGLHYLSMEYVDGEDLASLLKRIGRLPPDKALDIARELCAGLAAAHDKGVLHRDLKPANVMLDGRGHARITDFGLAVPLAGGAAAEREMAGTPAYMAPEQLTGGEVTTKSDLYALGLILYEVFTGKRPFEAKSVAERLRLLDTTKPESVTGIAGTDPAVERAILRCLEKDPKQRPSSALAVAGALPGGDPLAAALAAGETPSPEMVAAAGEEGALRPAIALACLAAVIAGLIGMAAMSKQALLLRRVPVLKPPEVLIEQAREIARKVGYAEPPEDSKYYFFRDEDYLEYVSKRDTSPGRWKKIAEGRPSPALFVYRQSPRPLVSNTFYRRVLSDDPPVVISGMVNITLDSSGRLVSFLAVPPQDETSAEPAPEPDWSPLFAAAELDPAKLKPSTPQWTEPVATDHLAAWEGVYPETDIPIRVEAGSYRGQPVRFAVIFPWTKPVRMGAQPAPPEGRLVDITSALTFVAVLIGSIFFVRRNMRMGRGDRSGAWKIAAFIFAARMLYWLFWTDHAPRLTAEIQPFLEGTGQALVNAALAWMMYMALEPYVRRRWPHMLISWNRLLAGQFRDPLVGRDLLLGCLFGTAIGLLFHLRIVAPPWIGLAGEAPAQLTLTFNQPRLLISQFFFLLGDGVGSGLTVIFLLLLLRLVLRKQWLAIPVLAGIATIFFAAPAEAAVGWVTGVLQAAALVFLLLRFGLFPLSVMFFFFPFLLYIPLTLHISDWYGPRCFLALATLAAIAAYGFFTSLGGQKVFSGALLEDEA